MKKIIIALLAAIIFTGCGVGNYSVASGKSDDAAVSFRASAKFPIVVEIDGVKYGCETVFIKNYKENNRIKETAQNTIVVPKGQHQLKVYSSDGIEIYNKQVLLGASEHRVIQL